MSGNDANTDLHHCHNYRARRAVTPVLMTGKKSQYNTTVALHNYVKADQNLRFSASVYNRGRCLQSYKRHQGDVQTNLKLRECTRYPLARQCESKSVTCSHRTRRVASTRQRDHIWPLYAYYLTRVNAHEKQTINLSDKLTITKIVLTELMSVQGH